MAVEETLLRTYDNTVASNVIGKEPPPHVLDHIHIYLGEQFLKRSKETGIFMVEAQVVHA